MSSTEKERKRKKDERGFLSKKKYEIHTTFESSNFTERDYLCNLSQDGRIMDWISKK